MEHIKEISGMVQLMTAFRFREIVDSQDVTITEKIRLPFKI